MPTGEKAPTLCERCKTAPMSVVWSLGRKQRVLCPGCNEKAEKLLFDWIELGWIDIPVKEIVDGGS